MPQQLSSSLPLAQMQSTWSGTLNPYLLNPLNNVFVIKNISLINGATIINHLLGQMQQGWFIVDINGSASIYRSQPFNDKTLTLTSNAAVTVNIGVF